ncbi:MAG TPA: trehalase family glycosidase [Spirochaetia bacterium]|nr:trehalase family glycosidase [Spirochaetia bacterium]
MVKKDFPTIHFYDQDFVDVYDQTWAWIQDFWHKGTAKSKLQPRFFSYPQSKSVNQFEACFSTFFLVYSNRIYPATPQLDNFYEKQEKDGAIRGEYNIRDGKPILTDENPEGVYPPLFSWAEHNLYHKIGNKKRIKDVMPRLEAYFNWLDTTFKGENGLYSVPLAATTMINAPREKMMYPIDFNAQQAMNALYMSELGDILNDKEISFKYKRHYFSLKTRINSLMWNEDDGIYCDLDKQGKQLRTKTVAAFWPLLAEIPNDAKAEKLIEHLRNPKTFGTENPFPTVAADEKSFDERGKGYRGSVYPPFTFMVVKGLEKYGAFDLARECSIRHLYYLLDTLHPESKEKGTVWEAYRPRKDGPAEWPDNDEFPRPLFLPYTALSTIALMIENVVGLYISLPRKTVDWIVPTLEIMGIENLSLKRNLITILSNKSGRGWEIRLESEKLYYFTIDILGRKKKTLPIPSGKCSMLIDKL